MKNSEKGATVAKEVMFIGYGAMAQEVVRGLPEGVLLRWVVVPNERVASLQAVLGDGVKVGSSIAIAAGKRPDLVLEMAGQSAVAEHAEGVLRQGWSLVVISTGALADRELQHRLSIAAAEGGGDLTLLSGAIAGIDGLSAAREGGLTKVLYRGIKGPESWLGSQAEKRVDLKEIAAGSEKVCFFKGSAREAAQQFPENANVAATIALAGLGLDETEVELVVDPTINQNQHYIEVVGRFGTFTVVVEGDPLPSNPKTSSLAAYSLVRACRQLVDSTVL